MSEFNSYAKRVNEIAQEGFAEYRKAEEEYHKAGEQRAKYTRSLGSVNSEYAAKSAEAEARYIRATEGLRAARQKIASRQDEIKAIGRNLEAAVREKYTVRPDEIDSNTLTLINSGMLKSNDYERLLKSAEDAGNHTMARLISKSARDAAERADKNEDRQSARALRAISEMVSDGSDQIRAFDYLADVYNRTANNPGMISHWDELTKDTVDKF